MINYEKIDIYKEKDRYVAQNQTNHFVFFGMNAEEVGAILRALLEEKEEDQ